MNKRSALTLTTLSLLLSTSTFASVQPHAAAGCAASRTPDSLTGEALTNITDHILSVKNILGAGIFNGGRIGHYALQDADGLQSLMHDLSDPYTFLVQGLKPHVLYETIDGDDVLTNYVFFAEAFGKTGNPISFSTRRSKTAGDVGMSDLNIAARLIAFEDESDLLRRKFSQITKILKTERESRDKTLFPTYGELLLFFGKSGVIDALYNYGVILYKGDGIAQNFPEALRYLEMAHAQGYDKAKKTLAIVRHSYGAMLFEGLVVAKNLPEAIRYLEMAADQGHELARIDLAKALNDYAKLLFGGEGVTQNIPEAICYYEKAAAHGNATAKRNLPKAQNYYAIMLLEGREVEKDLELSAYYFKLAADNGHSGAQFNYATLLLNCVGVNQNLPEAIRYLEMAADKGETIAQKVLPKARRDFAEEVRNLAAAQPASDLVDIDTAYATLISVCRPSTCSEDYYNLRSNLEYVVRDSLTEHFMSAVTRLVIGVDVVHANTIIKQLARLSSDRLNKIMSYLTDEIIAHRDPDDASWSTLIGALAKGDKHDEDYAAIEYAKMLSQITKRQPNASAMTAPTASAAEATAQPTSDLVDAETAYTTFIRLCKQSRNSLDNDNLKHTLQITPSERLTEHFMCVVTRLVKGVDVVYANAIIKNLAPLHVKKLNDFISFLTDEIIAHRDPDDASWSEFICTLAKGDPADSEYIEIESTKIKSRIANTVPDVSAATSTTAGGLGGGVASIPAGGAPSSDMDIFRGALDAFSNTTDSILSMVGLRSGSQEWNVKRSVLKSQFTLEELLTILTAVREFQPFEGVGKLDYLDSIMHEKQNEQKELRDAIADSLRGPSTITHKDSCEGPIITRSSLMDFLHGPAATARIAEAMGDTAHSDPTFPTAWTVKEADISSNYGVVSHVEAEAAKSQEPIATEASSLPAAIKPPRIAESCGVSESKGDDYFPRIQRKIVTDLVRAFNRMDKATEFEELLARAIDMTTSQLGNYFDRRNIQKLLTKEVPLESIIEIINTNIGDEDATQIINALEKLLA